MRNKQLQYISLFSIIVVLSAISGRAPGQSTPVRSLITQAVDETKMTVLAGNTHPLARAEFDRGAAPASLAMDHMVLVLKRTAEQETALETLLAQQQDKSSASYHKWLTPEQFGEQFGPSDQDVKTITTWLGSHGFQNVSVSNGRTTIDFSGTAGQVQQAFRTAIHSYVLANGEQHWANSSDPQIPVALAPAVVGVNSLNNFARKAMHHSAGVVRKSMATGKVTRVRPEFTFAGEPLGDCEGVSGSSNCWGVGPGDFDTIYNVPATINGAAPGTGQTIGIVSDSDVFASDVAAFRSIFGLPAITFNQIETGTDPGVQGPSSTSQDEEEAILDVEWSGAVATAATIDLVVSPTTNSSFGGDLSAEYIIDCQTTGTNCPVAVPAKVLAYSYGLCELELGSSGNAFYNTEWQQAVTEGITVVVSTGDNGSAGCDSINPSVSGAQPAEFGLAVNGVASTPFNVAVGGTDFNDFSNPTTYFNSSNNSVTQASAKGYIPETAYNDSCTNSIIYTALNLGSAAAACNNATAANDGLIVPAGGSGGVSNCTTPSGPGPSTCSGGYAKPSWQIGVGVPSDGKRDLPDVSLFAGDGTIQNFYITCESDLDVGNAPCSLTVPAGTLNGEGYVDFIEEGGTSVSVQAFAGVMALINQKNGSVNGSGNINPLLYTLAAEESVSSCSSSSGPASTCVFNDVTVGTNAMPCVVISGTPGCTVTGSNTIGILNGYNAGTGYDQATGLGSINIGNLVTNSGPNFYLTSSNPSVTIPTAGGTGTVSVTATAVGGFTGTITLSCSGLPTGVTCSSASITLGSSTPTTPATGSATLTLTEAAALLVPSKQRPGPGPWIWGAEGVLFLAFGAAVALASLGRQRRWNAGLAFAALVLMMVTAGCGGGSSSSSSSSSGTSSSGGSPTAATATVTGTSGSVSYPLGVTVTLD